MRKIIALSLLLALYVQPAIATCGYTVVTQSSTTSANLCPGFDGTFYVAVADTIKWSDVLLPSLVEVDYPTFNCATDKAVITRSSGTFIESESEPWIDYTYYKIELARRTSDLPGVKFIVDEVYSLSCARAHPSPVVINFEHGGLRLTGAAAGVTFDIDGDGLTEQVGWTRAGGDVAFLVHGPTVSDGKQLFGNNSPQAEPLTPDESANGYRALRVYDLNSDGAIDVTDPVWADLHFWFDWNHNGQAEASEVRELAEWGVGSISLNYTTTGKRDRWGNLLRQRAQVGLSDGSSCWSTDFYPVQVPKQVVTEQVIH